MFTSLVALACLATSALATPTKRDLISDCPLGQSALSIASFTLTAVHNNDSSIREPLALGAATHSGGVDILAVREN